jgi:hypothetical protein
MQTIEKTDAVQAAPISVVTRVRRRVAVVLGTLAFVIAGGVGVASAQTTPVDPLDGAGDSFFTDLTSYLTGTLIPAVIGLALVGIAVGMLLRWGKKAVKSS